ncbi:MAG: hypothetical protein AAB449_01150 [Patescibacteria group bacterium]
MTKVADLAGQGAVCAVIVEVLRRLDTVHSVKDLELQEVPLGKHPQQELLVGW